MKKILVLGIFGYKGGELNSPECYDTLTEAVQTTEELAYNSLGYVNDSITWDNTKTASREDFIAGFTKHIEHLCETSYAGMEDTVTTFFELDTESNNMRELSAKEIIDSVDMDVLYKLLQEDKI